MDAFSASFCQEWAIFQTGIQSLENKMVAHKFSDLLNKIFTLMCVVLN